MTTPGQVASSTRQRAELLDSAQWAQSLTGEQVKRLARYMVLERHPIGTTLFTQGARDSSLGIIVEGQLQIEKSGQGMSKSVLATLGKGKSYGEMALLDGEIRSASAQVLKPVSLLVLTPEAFERLCTETPALGIKLLLFLARMMSQRLRLTSSQLTDHLEAVGNE